MNYLSHAYLKSFASDGSLKDYYYWHVNKNVQTHEIQFTYCPIQQNDADILTKPLLGNDELLLGMIKKNFDTNFQKIRKEIK